MSNRFISPKPDGMLVMHCNAHGTPYSVFYGTAPFFTKEYAQQRIEEFLASHVAFRPDCALDVKIEDRDV